MRSLDLTPRVYQMRQDLSILFKRKEAYLKNLVVPRIMEVLHFQESYGHYLVMCLLGIVTGRRTMRLAMPDRTEKSTDHPPPDDQVEKPGTVEKQTEGVPATRSAKFTYPLLKRVSPHAPARTLVAWREELVFSQREMAEALGISDTSYNRYELGIRNPRPRTLRQIAERLGVSPKQITLLGPKRSTGIGRPRRSDSSHGEIASQEDTATTT